MEKRVRCFSSEYIYILENIINDYLCVTKGKMHDIKLTVVEESNDVRHFAMLIYTPEEDVKQD